MYLKLHYRHKDEHENNIPFNTSDFATLVIAWGEIALGLSFFGLNLCVSRNWKLIAYLINQLIDYSQRIFGTKYLLTFKFTV